MTCTLRLGFDIGSTTVKLVLLDGDNVLYETYRRHHADIARELDEVLTDVTAQFPDVVVRGAVTGSGGMKVATALGLPFVQEVVAETEAITARDPEADVIIELGGEDAKITYLKPVPEQRMNGSCAGGTGAFIDQCATLLKTDASGLNTLAERANTLYPIASRCGVFAKSDLQPLLNDGAPHSDLAASIFAAVATQTISGLACGRPIRGRVVFLGGPLYFLPQLRFAFEKALDGKASSFSTPERAQLYVAIGAAMLADSERATPVRLADLHKRLANADTSGADSHRMRALFENDAEREEFTRRHASAVIPKANIATAHGDCFLGIDAGSTTIKAVLVDENRRILFSHYQGNEGDPVGAAVRILGDLREALPPEARIRRTCVTGYGEGLVKAALRAEDGEIETMAHFRAADYLCPGVTSVIDIGGQDMKYLRVVDGVIDSIAVNEACSSGCGSFLQTFAASMKTDVTSFANGAVAATAPVDLGSRCTVFMNSSVKQAQKEGATPDDIAAGLSYAVVRNALYKVIKLKSPEELGERVVVQGGTFLNNAVLRAFELLTEREVVRPDIAGLMGAFGAALTARMRHHEEAPVHLPTPVSRLRTASELAEFTVETEQNDCMLCQNHCRRTVSTFDDGAVFVTGNRCDRGESLDPKAGRRAKSELPNVVEEKYKRLFAYRRLTEAKAFRGDIGIPRALNMYENYPFWFTVLTKLGFRVLISGRSSHELFERGMDSITSENICYPAKLTHGHVEDLIDRGVRTIFYPAVRFEQWGSAKADNHFSCPVVAGYPEVIDKNVERLRTGVAGPNGTEDVKLIMPFLNLHDREHLATRLAEEFADYGVTWAEAAVAIDDGFAEDAKVKADIREMGRQALEYMEANGVGGIVLAGRPYHADPEINHGIPEMINSLGLAVLTEDSVSEEGAELLERPLRVRDQWAYHSRLYDAAAFVASRPDLELVQLNSFGCGLDAITTDQVHDILTKADRIATTLKIDEVTNLGAARIRVRSLQAATGERRRRAALEASGAAGSTATPTNGTATAGRPLPVGSGCSTPELTGLGERIEFTREMRETHTLLVPQMAPFQLPIGLAALTKAGYNIEFLDTLGADDVDTGLQFVNNDSCFPAIVVIGQLLAAIKSGRYDPDKVTVILTQTGGSCRATNYVAQARKALHDAGYPQVPVLALSVGALEKNEGFDLTAGLLRDLVRGLVLGDVLQTCVLRTRPYEVQKGSVNRLHARWETIAREWVESGRSATLGHRISYEKLIEAIVADFADLPLRTETRKPRVGIVGEILVKFHPDANNHAIDVIEELGCEAVVPGIMGFVLQAMYSGSYNHRTFGTEKWGRWVKKGLIAYLERLQAPAVRALERSGLFEAPAPIAEIAEGARSVVQLGHQSGEGWYLVGEMVEMITHGVPNIICVQPFACLPNHITGKGMFGELRRRWPEANIVGIDYDPGASEVNQLNRIRLMVSTALKRDASAERDDRLVHGQRVAGDLNVQALDHASLVGDHT
ncbi:MAG: acyl-CoA dehydratase activase-related protein [Dermatophilus congolensis]|nr:acyl-CoA dehydratase activase-related protein [Dermatophilus congolensis]